MNISSLTTFIPGLNPETLRELPAEAMIARVRTSLVAHSVGMQANLLEDNRRQVSAPMGHNFDGMYADFHRANLAPTQVPADYSKDPTFSEDLTRHLISTAAQPGRLKPSAGVPEVSTEPVVRNILNNEVLPPNDAQNVTAPIVPVVGNVVDPQAYRSGLNVVAIREDVMISSTPGDQARADLAKAA